LFDAPTSHHVTGGETCDSKVCGALLSPSPSLGDPLGEVVTQSPELPHQDVACQLAIELELASRGERHARGHCLLMRVRSGWLDAGTAG
jgi:hypothetical protein